MDFKKVFQLSILLRVFLRFLERILCPFFHAVTKLARVWAIYTNITEFEKSWKSIITFKGTKMESWVMWKKCVTKNSFSNAKKW